MVAGVVLFKYNRYSNVIDSVTDINRTAARKVFTIPSVEILDTLSICVDNIKYTEGTHYTLTDSTTVTFVNDVSPESVITGEIYRFSSAESKSDNLVYASVIDVKQFLNLTLDVSQDQKLVIVVLAINDRVAALIGRKSPDSILKLAVCKWSDLEFTKMNGVASYMAGEKMTYTVDKEQIPVEVYPFLSAYLPEEYQKPGILFQILK